MRTMREHSFFPRIFSKSNRVYLKKIFENFNYFDARVIEKIKRSTNMYIRVRGKEIGDQMFEDS